ncbi:MAG: hypothetical protein HOA30_01195 [Rhodospirillaceae bacterium]|jgi:hypothetical protein|nr:hypothetical protein [Rhodospirillaceae bacterium]MBT3765105.1 hypothetical protein [Rhodospirillales bacterium]MBT6882666.1 hypothetical protein [Rhodospirillaceae bacterium]
MSYFEQLATVSHPSPIFLFRNELFVVAGSTFNTKEHIWNIKIDMTALNKLKTSTKTRFSALETDQQRRRGNGLKRMIFPEGYREFYISLRTDWTPIRRVFLLDHPRRN